MKNVLLIALFVAFGVQAETATVQASGEGTTCAQALASAKRNALDKTNGSFLHSVERSTDGSYTANVEEYSGGVIKSYKYLRDDCTFVIIEAEVERRSNVVQFTGTEFKKDQLVHLQGIKESDTQKQKAVRLLDDRRNATYFKTDKVEMDVAGSNVDVTIKGEFAYKDKWKADYKDIRGMFGWFNLPSFATDSSVLVTAYDDNGNVVFNRKVEADKWNMWYITKYGVERSVEVRIHETDRVKLQFRVPFDQLEKAKSFKVEIV